MDKHALEAPYLRDVITYAEDRTLSVLINEHPGGLPYPDQGPVLAQLRALPVEYAIGVPEARDEVLLVFLTGIARMQHAPRLAF